MGTTRWCQQSVAYPSCPEDLEFEVPGNGISSSGISKRVEDYHSRVVDDSYEELKRF
jgi:hypothetical protein